MKYLVLIGDGMSDEPLRELNGKTPLEAARTPNMDYLAQNGICGWVSNVPKGMPPGSDVAAMSILGYNPKTEYTGRGPLEAASLGVKLKKDEVCFRCNLVSIKNKKMDSFTAHHIKTSEADGIIKLLNNNLGSKEIKFYTGLSYRHLCVIKNKSLAKVKCFPPHDISGKSILPYLPNNKILKTLMDQSCDLLKVRKTKASMIWLWGQGLAPNLKKFPKSGAIITAVHLLKGLGKIIGLESIDVPGATGYLDTNYAGKARYALAALRKKDVVFVHVESPDEAGHEGSVKKKIRAIEDFDKYVVGTILKDIRQPGYPAIRILVLPDHPTPIKLMTHTSNPVPFVIFDPKNIQNGLAAYNEKAFKMAGIRLKNGYKLLKTLLFA